MQNERKHFVRKRVNTKTPNRKSSSVIISTKNMQWNIARVITDTIFELLPSDQIKNCNMELEKSQIKVQLSNHEAASKVIEHLNNKIVMEEKVTAYQDLTNKLASPKTTTEPTSSSPQEGSFVQPTGMTNRANPFVLPQHHQNG